MSDEGRPVPDESTARLLEQHRSGDSAALERLFARYVKPLERWAHGRLPLWARDIIDTQDLVQETLAQTLARIDQFESQGKGALHGYLRRAILNRVCDEIRKAARRPLRAEMEPESRDPAPSPLEAAIGSEDMDRYEQALEALRPEEREAIIARVEWGLTYAELAEALGKPTPQAARKTASRALVRLAQEMERGRRR